MIDAALLQALTEIFRDVFFREDIVVTPATNADDISGWDSQKQIEILMLCEERFGFEFTSREVDSLRTVGDLAEVIRARTS